jgi:hypothetical protein
MSNLRKLRALSKFIAPLLALIAGRGLVAALTPSNTLELFLAAMLVDDLHLENRIRSFPSISDIHSYFGCLQVMDPSIYTCRRGSD